MSAVVVAKNGRVAIAGIKHTAERVVANPVIEEPGAALVASVELRHHRVHSRIQLEQLQRRRWLRRPQLSHEVALRQVSLDVVDAHAVVATQHGELLTAHLLKRLPASQSGREFDRCGEAPVARLIAGAANLRRAEVLHLDGLLARPGEPVRLGSIANGQGGDFGDPGRRRWAPSRNAKVGVPVPGPRALLAKPFVVAVAVVAVAWRIQHALRVARAMAAAVANQQVAVAAARGARLRHRLPQVELLGFGSCLHRCRLNGSERHVVVVVVVVITALVVTVMTP